MSEHVSQLHADGSGWDDCFQASLLRYLRDLLILSPDGDVEVQLNEVSEATRGTPDSPSNPETDLPECARGLAHYTLPVIWTDKLQVAAASPYALCLVDGTQLQPAQYPASWFPGSNPAGNHFILWLPGVAYEFNDPLAYFNGQQDCQYSAASVAAAFVGAYLLPGGRQLGTPATSPQPARPVERQTTIRLACALKAQPNHTCVALTHLPARAPVTVLAERTPSWLRIVAGHYVGWVLASTVA